MKPSSGNLRHWAAAALIAGPLLAIAGILIAPSPNRAPKPPDLQMSVGLITPRPPERLRNDLAMYEPEEGCYLGAYIDLASELQQVYVDQNGRSRKLPSEFEAIVGRPHAMYFFYLGYGKPLPLDWVRKLTAQNKFVHIALEPNEGLERVQDDRYLQDLADAMRESGARIFLRFASEMNGTWVKYHGDPDLYIEKWRLVTRVMRERAPNVAMVWCPYERPVGNIPDYYPGDDYVDWVGINFYSVTYFNQDRKTPAFHMKPREKLSYIYERYSARKPIMICEYATTHFSALEQKNLSAFAIHNIRSLYSDLQTMFPRVKAINYFNTNNLELEHRQNNNYSVTHDLEVLQAYREAIKPDYFLSSPPDGLISGPGDEHRTLTSGVTLKGRNKIYFWPSDPKRVSTIELYLNGERISTMRGTADWFTTLYTPSFKPGEQTLNWRAFGPGGELLAQDELRVTIAH